MAAMDVWPTDAAEGSVATEARWRQMARHWTPSGVLAEVGGALKPTLTFPNLSIQSGAVWIDGHYAELPGSQVLTATANGIAVVRFDPAANSAELLWRDGVSVPTQSPTGVWEEPIAETVGSVLKDVRGLVSAHGGRTGTTRTTAQSSLPANAFTTLNWSITSFDSGGFIFSSTEAVIPPGLDGIYAVSAQLATSGTNVGAYISAQIGGLRIDTLATGNGRSHISYHGPLTAGTKVSFRYWGGTAGSSLPVTESQCNVYRLTP